MTRGSMNVQQSAHELMPDGALDNRCAAPHGRMARYPSILQNHHHARPGVELKVAPKSNLPHPPLNLIPAGDQPQLSPARFWPIQHARRSGTSGDGRAPITTRTLSSLDAQGFSQRSSGPSLAEAFARRPVRAAPRWIDQGILQQPQHQPHLEIECQGGREPDTLHHVQLLHRIFLPRNRQSLCSARGQAVRVGALYRIGITARSINPSSIIAAAPCVLNRGHECPAKAVE